MICGRKRKTHLAEHLQSNSDLIAAALDFLLAQGEHADVMKWRCLTAIISNRKDVVEKILADASVQEVSHCSDFMFVHIYVAPMLQMTSLIVSVGWFFFDLF